MTIANVVSVSGGKDSTATYLLALERGLPFSAVFADTGNEHEWTYDFVRRLPEITGGPAIQWVKADFSRQIDRKRAYVEKHWPAKGVDQEMVDRAVSLLHATGNPFLDLCLWKTRFPSSQKRFCTDELKLAPMFQVVQRPILQAGHIFVSWQGVRAEESLARSTLTKFQRINAVPYSMPKAARAWGEQRRAYAYRPLIAWTTEEVFSYHRRHGVPWNPLYDHGMSRVGCMPCIMCKKSELRSIADRFPGHIEKIAEWERLVSDVSKRGNSTFFNVTDDPVLADEWESANYDWSLERTGIRARIEWSRTTRGGRQYDLMAQSDLGLSCSAHGVCE